MEEPLLAASRKKQPTPLLISEDSLCMQGLAFSSTPSSIKERLIFGSPAALPDSLLQSDPFSEPLLLPFHDYSECAQPFVENQLLGEQGILIHGNSEHYGADGKRTPGFLPANIESPASPTKGLEQYDNLPDIERSGKGTKHLFRSRTAPAIFATNASFPRRVDFNVEAPPSLSSSMSVVSQAFIGLMIYLSVGMLIYTLRGQEFSGPTTNGFFDALYFCIVSMCTIGYGDITPVTPAAKLFSCAFVLVGFGFIDILLSAMVSYVLQKQETLLLNSVAAGPHETAKNYLVDVKKGRMRIRSKVFLAFGVVFMFIGVGTFMMHYLEGLGWLDSFYMSCMSVTTVGYGDHAFKTLWGRVFASVWLLVSTLAVAQSFLYLAEARIDKRHRLIAKRVLEKEMTLADLLAADIDNDGSVSKSDFVVYKLKEMRKIDEKDIIEICRQFSRLDPENSGKITLSCLINLHKASALKK